MNLIKILPEIQGRTFVVGDLHGCYDALSDELKKVSFDFDNDQLLSVGDLVDRGSQNMRCLRLLHKPWFHAVRGNHDDLVVGGMQGIDAYLNCWMQNGGEWIRALTESDLDELGNHLLPKLQELPYVIKFGNLTILHAEVTLDNINDIDIEDIQMLTWGRSRINSGDTSIVNGTDYIVVGHTPVSSPICVGNHVYIDTGACFPSGKLTLINIDDMPDVPKI